MNVQVYEVNKKVYISIREDTKNIPHVVEDDMKNKLSYDIRDQKTLINHKDRT